ncbi:hypothetical protein DER46DRAFT_570683 [Fusarium sp. MPI-SDFR-AT-0072]|nr:hypothetical protein DER46DRAFT_570683 [Fusarium sp. MPI-SDFR-AT-0072]
MSQYNLKVKISRDSARNTFEKGFKYDIAASKDGFTDGSLGIAFVIYCYYFSFLRDKRDAARARNVMRGNNGMPVRNLECLCILFIRGDPSPRESGNPYHLTRQPANDEYVSH